MPAGSSPLPSPRVLHEIGFHADRLSTLQSMTGVSEFNTAQRKAVAADPPCS